jgi:hypothetical protein
MGKPTGVMTIARNRSTGPPMVPALNSLTPGTTKANKKAKDIFVSAVGERINNL